MQRGFPKDFPKEVSLIFPRVQFKGNVIASQMDAREDQACQKSSLPLWNICKHTHEEKKERQRENKDNYDPL